MQVTLALCLVASRKMMGGSWLRLATHAVTTRLVAAACWPLVSCQSLAFDTPEHPNRSRGGCYKTERRTGNLYGGSLEVVPQGLPQLLPPPQLLLPRRYP